LGERGRKIGRIGGTWERTGRTGEMREKNRSKGKEGVENGGGVLAKKYKRRD
jgi:hypothetical protein